MTSAVHPRTAFTLIELLISMMLIAIVATVATTAFFQMLVMTRRLQARQTMDASAKTLFEKLNREITSIHPGAAVWLSSTTAPAQAVELVFMHGKESPFDFPTGDRDMYFTDLVWSRWRWTAKTGILEVAESSSARWFRIMNNQTRDYWKIPSGSKMSYDSYFGMSTFLSIPQLRRETGTLGSPLSPVDLLNENGWQSGEPNDLGDYEDLIRSSRPLIFNCSAVTIQIQNVDKTNKTADGSSPLTWAALGNYVDGRTPNPDLRTRPAVIRIRFTLTDPKVKTSNTYSFSCSATSLTSY